MAVNIGISFSLVLSPVPEAKKIVTAVPVVVSLTHQGRVTHICVSDLTIIGSNNGLSPGRRQAIIWTNAELLLNGPLGTNFSEILIEILTFSFKKMCLKVSSAKWRPFCLGLNVLRMTNTAAASDRRAATIPISRFRAEPRISLAIQWVVNFSHHGINKSGKIYHHKQNNTCHNWPIVIVITSPTRRRRHDGHPQSDRPCLYLSLRLTELHLQPMVTEQS